MLTSRLKLTLISLSIIRQYFPRKNKRRASEKHSRKESPEMILPKQVKNDY